jgi:hypothetical protein
MEFGQSKTGLAVKITVRSMAGAVNRVRKNWDGGKPGKGMHCNLADAHRHAPTADKPASALPD